MRIDRSLLGWGVFLVALGGVPLAVQQGWVDESIASDLWRLWPLVLVGIGLGLILRWTPLAWLGGAMVAATFGLIFGAVLAGGFQGVGSACVGLGSGQAVTTEDDGPVVGDDFTLQLELTCGELDVARTAASGWTLSAEHAADAPPLVDATDASLRITQGGDTALAVFTQQDRTAWDVTVPTQARLTVGVTVNASEASLDLGAGPISNVDATINFGDMTLDLGEATTPSPATLSLTANFGSAELALPDGAMLAQVTQSFGSLAICVPESAALRVTLESTASSHDLVASGLQQVGEAWQTTDFAAADDRIDLSITMSFASVTLERPEACA